MSEEIIRHSFTAEEQRVLDALAPGAIWHREEGSQSRIFPGGLFRTGNVVAGMRFVGWEWEMWCESIDGYFKLRFLPVGISLSAAKKVVELFGESLDTN